MNNWLDAWADGVARCAGPCALLDLETVTFLEVSPAAARLLGVTAEEARGASYLDFAPRPQEARQTIEMAREGLLDGVRGRRTFAAASGGPVDVTSYGQAVQAPSGQRFGLWVVTDLQSNGMRAPIALAPSSLCVAAVDGRWTIVDLQGDGLLGHEPDALIGSALLELVRDDHVARMLLLLARATTGEVAPAVVRFRDASGAVQPVVTTAEIRDEHADGRFHLTLVPTTDRRHVGVMPSASDLQRLPSLRDLPPRQFEVVARLVSGERVPTIAKALYLSPSTVRNHLTAVFRKFDVASQSELLGAIRVQLNAMLPKID